MMMRKENHEAVLLGTISFDMAGNVFAAETVQCAEPWVVRLSSVYKGKHYFLNTETKESCWVLPPELCTSSFVNVNNEESTWYQNRIRTYNNHPFQQPPISPIISRGASSKSNEASFPSNITNIVKEETNKTNEEIGATWAHKRPKPHRKIEFDATPSTCCEAKSDHPTSTSDKINSYSPMSLLNKLTSPRTLMGDHHRYLRSFCFGSSAWRSSSDRSHSNRNISSSKQTEGGNNSFSFHTSSFFGIRTPISSSSSRVHPSLTMSLSTSSQSQYDESESKILENNRGSNLDAKFEVLSGLGIGGFSTVVKVKNVYNNKTYAMKVISKKKIVQDQLMVELDIMKSESLSQSLFLQKCYYSFESNNNVFFVLDLYEGKNLLFHLRKNKELYHLNGFEEDKVKLILAELYLAISHLHACCYIHRDLKMENIMVNNDGHIKLIDFGLAVEVLQKVQPMSAKGSLAYMAPELIVNRKGGRHTDWWSYGVLAHELITGASPWTTYDIAIIKREIISTNTIQPVSKYICSKKLSGLIMSLLTRNVESRLGFHHDTEVKNHKFFKGIDWSKTAKLLSKAPFPSRKNNTSTKQDIFEEGHDDCLNSFMTTLYDNCQKTEEAASLDMYRQITQHDDVRKREHWIGFDNASDYL